MADPEAPYTVETFTAGDGYVWRYRRYLAAAPRAHVVCVHGIQSHGGWYEYSCTRLRQAGFAVDFLDRRGSGMNDKDRGDAPGFRRLLDDLAEYLKGVRDQGSGVRANNRPSPSHWLLKPNRRPPATGPCRPTAAGGW